MDVARFLDRIRTHPEYAGQLAHVEVFEPRGARYDEPDQPLSSELARMLTSRGIDQLYCHQAQALELGRAGQDFVAVTGTASGKTLCYQLPIIERLLDEEDARALYLFPTKALAQDQLKGLLELISGGGELAERIVPGVYDGDTPPAQRRRIKAEANLILTNPDMLHASLLPYHPKWARMFGKLRFVVLDEVHQYRGILGANVACVLRRLMRICRHYGARPVFLATSATIANPGELVEGLLGRKVAVVDDDGAPRGRKYFGLWNPAPLGNDTLARRSATDDATSLMVEAMECGAQVLAFARTRQSAELIQRYTSETLSGRGSPLARQVRAYRGGYLPLERRQIEADLASGALKAVAATNALELGIDIGSLDVALLVGYPGTIASVWQQAGRSGRRADESLAILLASNDAVDQYMLRHPAYFFGRSVEHAVVDPENPYVLSKHLRAAAFELPLADADRDVLGPLTQPIAGALTESGQLAEIDGVYYFAGDQNPAARISLRHMSDNTFAIVEQKSDGATEVIANVDAISAPELVYPEAIYLHNGQPYQVRQLDFTGKIAYVQRCDADYYTQAVLESHVRILATRAQANLPERAGVSYGDLDVSWQTVAFKKIKFHTRENLGLGPVDLPSQSLCTTGLWIDPSDAVRTSMKAAGLRVSEGLCGLRNLVIVALPMVAMCDSRDTSGVVDSKNLGRAALVVYDRYPGGLGYCEKGFCEFARLMETCLEMVRGCPCDEGCPSCVGLPQQRPAIHSDPDLSRGYPVPSKAAAERLTALVVGEDLTPITMAAAAGDPRQT